MCVGFESLVRWTRTESRLRREFIPIAESSA